MKLFHRGEISKGQMIPEAFVHTGYNTGHAKKYLCITFPLYQLAEHYMVYSDSFRLGWWCPSVLFTWNYEELNIKWRWQFMDNFMGEISDKQNSLFDLPVFRGPWKGNKK